MEDGKKLPALIDPKRCFRHPWMRMLLSLLIVFLDFIIFAEDPIQDSEIECNLPVVGNVVNMVIARWPSDGLVVLKIFMLLIGIIVGCFLGRQVIHHRVLRDWLHLKAFRDKGEIKDQGSFFCMGIAVIPSIFIASKIYNAMVGDNAPQVGSNLGITNREFGKIAQCGTWLGDLATIVMVWDAMLQDPNMYVNWAKSFKGVYINGCNGWLRVLFTWGLAGVSTALLFVSVFSAGGNGPYSWKSNGLVFSNEVSRVIVVMLIHMVDVIIVMQDWDFPSFKNPPLEVKVAGTFSHDIQCCKCLSRILDNPIFLIRIAGKWMNYGPLIVIIMLDMNMLKNQIIYDPAAFGQYTDPNGAIYTIIDQNYTNRYFVDGLLIDDEAAGMISYEARWGRLGTKDTNLTAWEITSIESDIYTPTRYFGTMTGLTMFFAGMAILSILFFIFSIWYGNRLYRRHLPSKPTMESKAQEEQTGQLELNPINIAKVEVQFIDDKTAEGDVTDG